MILWVLLFVLVVAISFILAAKSMRDFTETVSRGEEYGLFLIRKREGLNKGILESILQHISKSNLIISLERLFKGSKSALVVFGPRHLLLNYKDDLALLELEDYANANAGKISAWEVGIKNKGDGIFRNLPQLQDSDQFWWQLAFSNTFKPQITAIAVSPDVSESHKLGRALQNLAPDKVIKLPKAFSNEQILEFYKSRSIRKENKNPVLSPEEILQLISI